MAQSPIIKIRQLRELRGYSQQYMAQQLGISQRAYSKIERNETQLNWKRIAEIASILDIDPIQLVTFDEARIFKLKSPSLIYGEKASDQLIKQYERQIQRLEDEINFLRKMLEK